MKFRDLAIGTSFDWINPVYPHWTSFYLRCVKISARKYRDENGTEHRIRSINAEVFHVGE